MTAAQVDGKARRWFLALAPWMLGLALLGLGACKKKAVEKKDPAQAARQYLEQIVADRADKAYQEAAFALQSAQSQEIFEQKAREQKLAGAKVESLTVKNAQSDSAELAAELTTIDRKKLEAVVKMTFEREAWRLAKFEVSTALPPGRRIPSEEEMRALVHASMLKFAEAVQQKDFSALYASLAIRWQMNLTVEKLHTAFKSFIDKGVNLSGVSQHRAIFDEEAHFTREGPLEVSGHYPTTVNAVYFKFRYVYEPPQWKPYGLDVQLKQVGDGRGTPAPGAAGPAAPTPAPGTPAPQ